MERMIRMPHLPTGRVSVAVSGGEVPVAHRIPTMIIPTLPKGISHHADLQLCHLGENVFLSCPEAYLYYKEKLSPLGAVVLCGETPLGYAYPKDAAYNILRVGHMAFHNTKITDPAALRYFEANGIRICHIRQGYAKCAVTVLAENAMITADRGICRAARAQGMDVLLISEGHVSLSGYAYGFIGGSSFFLSGEVLYFTGSLQAHPDREAIYAFAQKYGKRVIEDTKNRLMDIGSVIPVLQTEICPNCEKNENFEKSLA